METNKWAFRLEKEYFENHKELPVKVYMSMGEIEFFYPPFPEFVNTIENRKYKGLKFKWELLREGRHFSVISEALSRGLKNIYSKDSIYELMIKFINDKDIDFAIKQYYLLKQQSSNQYNFTESELNSLGYFLLGMNKVDDAIKIFKLNIESYPEWNCYVSLGEAYMIKGNKLMAIKNYEMALKMSPKSKHEQIKEHLENLRKK